MQTIQAQGMFDGVEVYFPKTCASCGALSTEQIRYQCESVTISSRALLLP